MPLYRVLTRTGLLTDEQRQAFSRQVTDVHCAVTGAPPTFVHVLYAEDHQGQLDASAAALVFGTIRHGRNDTQKHDISQGLSRALAAHAGVDDTEVIVTIDDIRASYTMEGGKLLPEPGSPEEKAWMTPGAAH